MCRYCGDGVSEGAIFALGVSLSHPPSHQQQETASCVQCCDERGLSYNGTSDDFTDSSLGALSRILSATGAEIVLSSTWRFSPEARQGILDEFREYRELRQKEGAGEACLPTTLTLTTSTEPAAAGHYQRQREIADWLETHQTQLGVTSWAVLDDDPTVLADERFAALMAGHVVQCDSCQGLTDAHANLAIEILLGTAAPASITPSDTAGEIDHSAPQTEILQPAEEQKG